MNQQSRTTAAAVAADNSLSTQDMWEMYLQGIISATGLPGSNLILTGTTLPAEFITNSVGMPELNVKVPQALAQIYELGDSLAVPTGFYTPAGQSLFSDYATYIDNLEPKNANPTAAQQATINIAKAKLNAASGQYDTDLTAAAAAFNQESPLLPGKWPTFQEFLNTTSWGGTLNTDQNVVDGANSQLNTLYTDTYGNDYVAINQAKRVVDQVRSDRVASAPSSPAGMLINTDAGNSVVPTYNPSSLADFSAWLDAAVQGQEKEVNFTIRKGAGQFDTSQSAYFSRTSWSENFFFFSIAKTSTEERHQLDVDTSSSSFSVDVSFKAVTSVQIDTGAWFDSSLLYAYSNPSGLVAPAALIVALMPKVTVTFDAASFQSASSSVSSTESSSVGIFNIIGGGDGSSSSSSSLKSSWDSTALTLTIEDDSTQPKIIGLQVWEPKAS